MKNGVCAQDALLGEFDNQLRRFAAGQYERQGVRHGHVQQQKAIVAEAESVLVVGFIFTT